MVRIQQKKLKAQKELCQLDLALIEEKIRQIDKFEMPDWKNQFESGNEMDKNTKDDFNEI